MHDILRKHRLKMVPILGKVFIVCDKNVHYDVFRKALFVGDLSECKVYLESRGAAHV